LTAASVACGTLQLFPKHKSGIGRQPSPHRGPPLAACLGCIAIVARESIKPQLQHNFRRARRPTALAFHIFEALEKAAYVQQKPNEFRSYRLQRLAHLLARRNDPIGEGSHATRLDPAPPMSN
jgi:hypothetical protein